MVNDADICRCCGDVTNNLKDMNAHFLVESNLKLIDWFFMFTNLDINNFCDKYTKICKVCEQKLRQAHEFREECLMGEFAFAEEAYAQNIDFSSFTNEEYTDEELPEELFGFPAAAEPNAEADNKNDFKQFIIRPPLKKIQPSTYIPQRQQTTVFNSEKAETVTKKAKIFMCKVCGMTFPASNRLKNHMVSHSDEQPYCCTVCNQWFKKKVYLINHMKAFGKYHKEATMPNQSLLCGVCGATFAYPSRLKSHIKIHGDKTHSCPVCKKQFRTRVNLARHMEFHSSTKKFECHICQKKFQVKITLRAHLADHFEDMKKYVCLVCDKRFLSPTYLNRHMNIHTDNRPYPCTLCDKKFRRAQVLNIHFRREHTDFSYECKECNAEYKNPNTFKLHILLKHQGAKLICHICSMEFAYKKAIVEHLKKTHNTGYDQSVHVVLATKERLVRISKLNPSIIQTEKFQSVVTNDVPYLADISYDELNEATNILQHYI